MPRRSTSVARAVLVFALSGILVLLVVGMAGVLLLQRVGTDQATREAENLAVVAGRGVVQPRIEEGIKRGGAASLVRLDAIVQAAVLNPPIVRARVWTPDGQVVYAGEAPELIGSTFALDPIARQAQSTGEVVSGTSDASLAQNRGTADEGMLEVVVPIQTLEGEPLLFEAAMSSSSVQSSALELWRTFLPVLAVALVAFAALEIPLAYGLARRVRESQLERERLLQRAIDASDLERRRITSDLHDGLVQEFAGIAMSLSALAEQTEERDPEAAASLQEAAGMMRGGMRSLRSAVMGIYPPTLQRAGLPAALSDLVAPLEAQGVGVAVEVPASPGLEPATEALIFRCAQESVRNIVAHARATEARVAVEVQPRTVTLLVSDNGAGFTQADRDLASSDGHVGLRLLEDLAGDARGTLEVSSTPGEGTTVRLELPR